MSNEKLPSIFRDVAYIAGSLALIGFVGGSFEFSADPFDLGFDKN